MARRRETDPDQIVQAALRCFAAHGYEATRTAAIAREAGVSEGTLYNYFEGKQALFVAVVEYIHEVIEDTFAFTATEGTDLDRFYEQEAARLAAFARENRELVEIVVRDVRHREVSHIAAGSMDRHRHKDREGASRLADLLGLEPDEDEAMAIEIGFHAGIEQIVTRWCVGGGEGALEPELKSYMRGFVSLLGKAAGPRRRNRRRSASK